MILSDINDKLCKFSSFIPDIFTSMGNNPFLDIVIASDK